MQRLRPAVLVLVLIFLAAAAQAGSPSDAELTRLRDAYALRFFDPEAHVALARALHDKGHRLTAFSILETARTVWFGDEKFDAAFSKAFRRDPFDNSAEAEAKLRAAAATSSDKETLRKLGDVYLSRGDWDNARTWLQKAIAADPEDADLVQVLAEVERRAGRVDEAAKRLGEFRKTHPRNPWSMLMQAIELRDSDPGAAMTVIDEALKSHPHDAALRRARGALLQDSGRNELAAAEYKEAARLAPDDADIQGWTGRFFLKVMKDEDKALDYYLNAYFLDPHFL
ncbi:MAG TPA: tetratricopeptide repeat protein [Thermoanaerobaculia bacterium]|jgi:tetratricopeptide (TPR) repeat protein